MKLRTFLIKIPQGGYRPWATLNFVQKKQVFSWNNLFIEKDFKLRKYSGSRQIS